MWKAIESAPKDGGDIVLLIGGIAIQGSWDNETRADGYVYGDGKWCVESLPSHGCGCCSAENDPPTHWQPLPEPPK